MNNFINKSIVSIRDYSREDFEHLFQVTQRLKKEYRIGKYSTTLKGLVLCSLFYEVSTRTRFSYETAMLRMGGNVIGSAEAGKQTSAAKGETLKDAIRVIEQYADILILRHPQTGAANEAAIYSNKPIINGGDGTGEHPTQGFSDIYTILEECGSIDGLNITLLGDLKYSRAIHSIALGLANFDIHTNFVSPKGLEIPHEIMDVFKGKSFAATNRLSEVLRETDVIYMTRTQLERFQTNQEREEYLEIRDSYNITSDILNISKPGMIIMHPGPRIGGEVSEDLDDYIGFAYFRQVENAIFNRMALLGLIFGKTA